MLQWIGLVKFSREKPKSGNHCFFFPPWKPSVFPHSIFGGFPVTFSSDIGVFLRLRTALEALLSEANELPPLEEVWHKTMMKQLDDNMMKRYKKHRHRSVKTKVKSFDQNL